MNIPPPPPPPPSIYITLYSNISALCVPRCDNQKLTNGNLPASTTSLIASQIGIRRPQPPTFIYGDVVLKNRPVTLHVMCSLELLDLLEETDQVTISCKRNTNRFKPL